MSAHTTSRADIARLKSIYQLAAPHRMPLLEAVEFGVIALGEVTRSSAAPTKEIDRTGLPSIILVGDDDGQDSGPTGWMSARRLAYWARYGFVHATGGTVESYRNAVRIAVQFRKLVLVETGTSHVMAWHGLFANAGVPTMNLIPSDGGVHPVAAPAETVH